MGPHHEECDVVLPDILTSVCRLRYPTVKTLIQYALTPKVEPGRKTERGGESLVNELPFG